MPGRPLNLQPDECGCLYKHVYDPDDEDTCFQVHNDKMRNLRDEFRSLKRRVMGDIQDFEDEGNDRRAERARE